MYRAMKTRTRSRFVPALAMLSVLAALPGCLLIRTTEHRIQFKSDGSGEALMRLVDIRSDGATDSARIRDFGVMMASVEKEGAQAFEKEGRRIVSTQFMVRGDTLDAEISYTFPKFDSVEGLKKMDDELFVVVNAGREILRTNGKIKPWEHNSTRIVWPKDARRLMYQIREKTLPASTSLAALYLRYGHPTSSGGH